MANNVIIASSCLGRVVAGTPILAEQNEKNLYLFQLALLRSSKFFYSSCSRESMIMQALTAIILL